MIVWVLQDTQLCIVEELYYNTLSPKIKAESFWGTAKALTFQEAQDMV